MEWITHREGDGVPSQDFCTKRSPFGSTATESTIPSTFSEKKFAPTFATKTLNRPSANLLGNEPILADNGTARGQSRPPFHQIAFLRRATLFTFNVRLLRPNATGQGTQRVVFVSSRKAQKDGTIARSLDSREKHSPPCRAVPFFLKGHLG